MQILMNFYFALGLEKSEIKYLAENTEGCVKTSRRDLAYVLSKVGISFWIVFLPASILRWGTLLDMGA